MRKNKKMNIALEKVNIDKMNEVFSLDKYKVKLEPTQDNLNNVTNNLLEMFYNNEKSDLTKNRENLKKKTPQIKIKPLKTDSNPEIVHLKRKETLDNLIKQKEEILINHRKRNENQKDRIYISETRMISIEQNSIVELNDIKVQDFNNLASTKLNINSCQKQKFSKKESIKRKQNFPTKSETYDDNLFMEKLNKLKQLQDENSILTSEIIKIREERDYSNHLNNELKNILETNNNIRRAMNEQLQILKGNTRVYCRIKPLQQSSRSCLELPSQGNMARQVNLISNTNKSRSYYFDKIFDETSSQDSIFKEVEGFVQSAFDGNFVTMFAYGQTGSGKTFTLEGDNQQCGILSSSIGRLCQLANESKKINKKVFFKFSCLEIYNDKIQDLIDLKNCSQKQDTKVTQKDNTRKKESFYKKEFDSFDEAQQIVTHCQQKRKVDINAYNSKSSRSHCIYMIAISNMERKGKLFIIDLAGSERSSLDSDKVDIEKQKKISIEAAFINKSLTALGRIIRLMKEQKKSFSNVSLPVRETKLTKILEEAFGDNCLMVIIINVCCEEQNYSQTRESLNFGAMICS